MQSALAGLMGMGGPPPGGGPPPPGAPGGAAAPPNPATLGTGPPPNMPGLPPAPEMIGKMPTGSLSSTPKASADIAIASLRDAKGYFPNLGDSIEAMIAQLQDAGAQASKAPAPVGVPGGPGANVPLVPPTSDSGTKGGF